MGLVTYRSAAVLKSRMTGIGRTPWALEHRSCMGTGEAATPGKGTELRTQPKAGGYTGHRAWAGPALSWLHGVDRAVRQMT